MIYFHYHASLFLFMFWLSGKIENCEEENGQKEVFNKIKCDKNL